MLQTLTRLPLQETKIRQLLHPKAEITAIRKPKVRSDPVLKASWSFDFSWRAALFCMHNSIQPNSGIFNEKTTLFATYVPEDTNLSKIVLAHKSKNVIHTTISINKLMLPANGAGSSAQSLNVSPKLMVRSDIQWAILRNFFGLLFNARNTYFYPFSLHYFFWVVYLYWQEIPLYHHFNILWT